MSRKQIQQLLEKNDLVGGIHDYLLDHNIGVADAFDDACAWIAELHLQVKRAERGVSAGFTRTDTTNLKWKPKAVAQPVDDADAWIKV